MRILFILENYYPNIGGVETLFKSLAESLATEDYQITVLTNKFDESLENYEELNKVHIHRLNLSNRYLFTFLAGFKAIGIAKKHDLIHTTSYNAAVPAFVASIFSGKKVIITFHEVWGKLWFTLPFMNRFALLLHFLFEWFILKLPFHKFIAVSNSTKKMLMQSGIREYKTEMIYNCIDYEDFKMSDAKKENSVFRFCYFGRLGISKGLDLILGAVEILKARNIDFNFLLILPKTPESFLITIQDLIDKKDIRQFVEIKHELSFEELKSNVYNSDAVVIPSYSEGFCFTAVESMALDTAIISSANTALKEVVSGKYLEMQEHSSEDLADKMQQAVLGNWSYTNKNAYPLSDSINAYIKMYESLDI